MTAVQHTNDPTHRALPAIGWSPKFSWESACWLSRGYQPHHSTQPHHPVQAEQETEPPALQVMWSGQAGEPRGCSSFIDQCRLPPGKDRQAAIWMKGWLQLQLSQSHFNLFYLGMGDRKGKKKKESFPTSLQKNTCKFPSSKWSGWVSAHCCPRRLSGMKPLLKAFGSMQLERVLVVFQVQSLPP